MTKKFKIFLKKIYFEEKVCLPYYFLRVLTDSWLESGLADKRKDIPILSFGFYEHNIVSRQTMSLFLENTGHVDSDFLSAWVRPKNRRNIISRIVVIPIFFICLLYTMIEHIVPPF